MTLPGYLDTGQIADRMGVARSTISTYLSRGYMPPADGRIAHGPVWRVATIDAWLLSRPGRGAGGGRPRKTTGKVE